MSNHITVDIILPLLKGNFLMVQNVGVQMKEDKRIRLVENRHISGQKNDNFIDEAIGSRYNNINNIITGI